MSKPSTLSRSSSSESIVESSSHETPTVEEKSKSSPPPVMKNKTKKSAQREAFIASSSTSLSSTYSEKNHDIRKSFKTEIDTARDFVLETTIYKTHTDNTKIISKSQIITTD